MTRFLSALLAWLLLTAGAFAISVHSASTGVSNGSGGTSQPIVLPSSTQSGDRLACMLDLSNGGGTATTATWPGGWTVISQADSSDASVNSSLGYKVATGSEGGTTITPTASQSSTTGAYFCWDIAGSDTTTAPAIAWHTNATSTATMTMPSLSPSWGTAAVSLLMININGYPFGVPISVSSWSSGYTGNQQSQAPGSSLGFAAAANRTAAVSTESPGTTTLNDQLVSALTATFAFKAAGGGTISIPMLGM